MIASFFCAGLAALAGVAGTCLALGRFTRLRRRMIAAGSAGFLALACLALATAAVRPAGGGGGGRIVYLLTSEPDLLARFAALPSSHAVTTLVTSPAAEAMAATAMPSTGRAVLDGSRGGEGILFEDALADLHARLAGRSDEPEVVLLAPRTADPTGVRGRLAVAKKSFPWLHEGLRVLLPADLGAEAPVVRVECPATLTPDVTHFGVLLAASGLSPGSTVYAEATGRRRGDGVSALTATRSVGPDAAGRLVYGGPPMRADSVLERRGRLEAPADRQTLVVRAAARNRLGETTGRAAASVTTRVQPLGVVVPAGRATGEPLRQLLQNAGVEVEPVALTGDAASDRLALARWRLVLVDGRLEPNENAAFKAALADLPVRPTVLFVGMGGGDGLTRGSVAYDQPRKIGIMSDVSGSFNDPPRDRGGNAVPGYSRSCGDIARGIAEALNPGIDARNTTRVLVAHKNNAESTTRDFVGTEEERNSGQFELAHHLRYARDLWRRDRRYSDFVSIFDPADVDADSVLPADARKAAEELVAGGVRLHLVALGRIATDEVGVNDLGETAYRGVVATMDWVRGSATPVSGEADLQRRLKRVLFDRVFPRLPVGAAPEAVLNATLPGSGRKELASYLTRRKDDLLRINALTSFRPRPGEAGARRWSPAEAGNVPLWLGHWGTDGVTGPAAPLLVREDVPLPGAAGSATAYRLLLDVQAENAAGVDAASPSADALAGLFVRIASAVSGEWVAPDIHFRADRAGLLAFRADYEPFVIRPAGAAAGDPTRGVGAGVFRRDAAGAWVAADHATDARTLDHLRLTPRRGPDAPAELLRFVVEDGREPARPRRLAVDVPVPPAGTAPLDDPAELRDLGLSGDAAPVAGPAGRPEFPAPVLWSLMAAAAVLLLAAMRLLL